MKKFIANKADQLVRLFQVALLIISAALVLIPATRLGYLPSIFKALFLVQGLLILSRAFRLGHQRRTSEEIFAQAQTRGGRILAPFEMLCFAVAVGASIVLAGA